jgi:tetratricopeptide (TPR) repeat protein
MRSTAVLVLVLCGLLLTGCAGGAHSAPAAAPVGWRRIQTEHIDLITDLSDARALDAALRLERTRAALLAAAWSKLPSTRQTARLRVLSLADGLEFERYFGRNVDGLHTSLGGDTILLWGTARNWERRRRLTDVSTTSTLRHEMVHHLAAGIYLRQPRWFSEGLAQFLETVTISEDGAKATLGLPNLDASSGYRSTRSLDVKDALAWRQTLIGDNERQTRGLYGLSWMMVTWMFNTQREAFGAFEEALARGEDPERAWAATFGKIPPEELDKTLYQYALHGNVTVFKLDLAPVDAHASSVPLDAADVHAVRAQLALVAAGMKAGRDHAFDEEAEREIAEALAIEPGHVASLRLSHATQHPLSAAETLARLREQTRRRPDDGEAWLFLGARLRGPTEAADREAALRKAVALLPDNATAYNDLAWHLVRTGRAEEALPLATKASLRAPWNSAVLDTYAACLFAVGRCPDALRLETRAVDNLSETIRDRPASRPFTEALLRYQTACGAEAAPAPPAAPAPTPSAPPTPPFP